jgi:hypothetical protein
MRHRLHDLIHVEIQALLARREFVEGFDELHPTFPGWPADLAVERGAYRCFDRDSNGKGPGSRTHEVCAVDGRRRSGKQAPPVEIWTRFSRRWSPRPMQPATLNIGLVAEMDAAPQSP